MTRELLPFTGAPRGADRTWAKDVILTCARHEGGRQSPVWLAVSRPTVAWLCGPSNDANGAIRTLSTAGGNVTTLLPPLDTHLPIAIANGRVFWGTYGAVASIPLAGGTNVVLKAGIDGPTAIAVDGTHVYWLTHRDELFHAPEGGGPPVGGALTGIATGSIAGWTNAVLVDEARTYVVEYWATATDGAHGRIHARPK